jgi:hypothetical protein
VVLTDCKHAGEVRLKGLDLTDLSTQFWMPGMVVPSGFAIRPAPAYMSDALGYSPRLGPDGYEYVASIPGGGITGQAGRKEPKLGANPVVDGSITWTRRAVSADSLFRTISAPLTIEWIATDMTITQPVYVVGSVLHVAAHHGGGTEGETHRVIARVPYSDGTVEEYAIDWTIQDDGVE